uniref:Putative tick transposon n=1 Tax=Ixodes ricinus TaxID=34613 RepID=A0A6B0UH80_IXORI
MSRWSGFRRREREHAAATKATLSGHLTTHCSGNACASSFGDTWFLARYLDRVSRELREAFEIQAKDKKCISDTSLSLSWNEYSFLLGELNRT